MHNHRNIVTLLSLPLPPATIEAFKSRQLEVSSCISTLQELLHLVSLLQAPPSAFLRLLHPNHYPLFHPHHHIHLIEISPLLPNSIVSTSQPPFKIDCATKKPLISPHSPFHGGNSKTLRITRSKSQFGASTTSNHVDSSNSYTLFYYV